MYYNISSITSFRNKYIIINIPPKFLVAVIQKDLSSLAKRINTSAFYDKLENKLANKTSKIQRQIKMQQRKLEDIQKRITNMLSKLADDLITIDEYRLFALGLEAEKQELEDKLAKHDGVITNEINVETLIKLHEEFKKAMNFENLPTEILNRFIAKIEIKEDCAPASIIDSRILFNHHRSK